MRFSVKESGKVRNSDSGARLFYLSIGRLSRDQAEMFATVY